MRCRLLVTREGEREVAGPASAAFRQARPRPEYNYLTEGGRLSSELSKISMSAARIVLGFSCWISMAIILGSVGAYQRDIDIKDPLLVVEKTSKPLPTILIHTSPGLYIFPVGLTPFIRQTASAFHLWILHLIKYKPHILVPPEVRPCLHNAIRGENVKLT